MAYIGNPLTSMTHPVDYFTGDGSTSAFTLSQIPASASSILVSVNGVKLVASSSNPGYYLNGHILTLNSVPVYNATIEVVYLGVLSQINVPADLSIDPDKLSVSVSNNLVYIATANGSQNTFTLPFPPISANSMVVTANGVVQYDYTLEGSNLVLGFTPAEGTILRTQSLGIAKQIVPVDGSVGSSALQSNLTLSGNTVIENLTITGNFNSNTSGGSVGFEQNFLLMGA